MALAAEVSVERGDFSLSVVLEVAAGECLGLVGPSGAGKSTLLEALAGLVPEARGTIRLAGRELSKLGTHERRIGLLRQEPALFPHLSVAENLSYARPGRGLEPAQAMAARLGLGALLDARPAGLSGGQRQRVALGRLLLSDPDVLLLDEPFEGLEPPLRRELSELVLEELAARQLPAVAVAHHLDEVQALSGEIALLEHGQVLQVGPAAEIVRAPASVKVAELLGYRTFLPGTRAGECIGVHPGRARLGSHLELGVPVAGRLMTCRPSGARWLVELEVGEDGGRLAVELDSVPAAPGEVLGVTLLDPPRFGPDGRAIR
ncbi:MAG: transporter related [Acidimicrobiaceae bacterium]|nr:transporter related [Acidimicrobiaceae bacterium]